MSFYNKRLDMLSHDIERYKKSISACCEVLDDDGYDWLVLKELNKNKKAIEIRLEKQAMILEFLGFLERLEEE